MPADPVGKHLFIAHLAEKLQAMESGRVRLEPLSYRVHVKMLVRALAGYPEAQLEDALGGSHPAVREALANRFFADTGHLKELGGGRSRRTVKGQADRLIARLREARPLGRR
jgi:hypothetical protein